MPKTLELTIEIEIQKISCPGVWLCQDGRVSLTVFALGTSYQTCLLPPVFPLTYRDVFYFRKRFKESCALNNICCLLKDETIYCELVQWCDDCMTQECVLLAQYLGSLSDVLFPPNMCSNDGVDLLMRRTSDFPGILSPKIEIATKVRIDEIWDQNSNVTNSAKVKPCQCNTSREGPQDVEGVRQRQVCHSAQYHRSMCNQHGSRRTTSTRSRSRSNGSRSCVNLNKEDTYPSCRRTNRSSKLRDSPPSCPRPTLRRARPCKQYTCYSVEVSSPMYQPNANLHGDNSDDETIRLNETETTISPQETRSQKLLLESRYIDQDRGYDETPYRVSKKCTKIGPCVCEICKKYHEIFHANR